MMDIFFSKLMERAVEEDDRGFAPDPKVFKAWGQQIAGSELISVEKKREPEGSLFYDDYSSPIRLSLSGLLLSRARLRFTEPLIFH